MPTTFKGRTHERRSETLFSGPVNRNCARPLLDVYDQIPIDQGYLWRRSEAGQYVSWIRLLRESAPGLLLRMPSRLQDGETCFYCDDVPGEGASGHSECDAVANAAREHLFMKCVSCSNEHFNVSFREHSEAGLPPHQASL